MSRCSGQEDMIRELLTSDDFNVISVDWRLGASQSYPQAVANTRALGLVVADFLDYLQRKYRIPPSDIHIIGHNLGAHAAGYVGEQIPRIGRITVRGVDFSSSSLSPSRPTTPSTVRSKVKSIISLSLNASSTNNSSISSWLKVLKPSPPISCAKLIISSDSVDV
ncbi:inactive pancreatic lipase-related protein 1 [Trichonephila clavipes]|nr:inactive pancreatic lipase-related protein 1 [Trichonephila clavipes]